MNILFLTLLDFASIEERGIYTDLMRKFVEEGHMVYIVSPTEKRKNQPISLVDGYNHRILKPQIGNIQKTNLIEKGISTLTLEATFKRAIRQHFYHIKFDLILYSTPPITLLSAVRYAKNKSNAYTYLLLKDIFPQNAVDLGMLSTSGPKAIIYKYFKNKEKHLYRISDYIGCMSQANVDYLIKHNPQIPSNSIEVCPNSMEPSRKIFSEHEKEQIRLKYNLPTDKTLFLYGGNLGKPQGIEFLIECIKANNSNDNAYFIIAGSGTEYNRLKQFLEQYNPNNALLIKSLSTVDFEALTAACHVGLIFLDKRFTIPNFPSRLLSYMNASLPVLASTDTSSDIGKVITEGEFGLWSKSGDINAFNENVSILSNKNTREKMGGKSRDYLETHYTVSNTYNIIMKHFKENREGQNV